MEAIRLYALWWKHRQPLAEDAQLPTGIAPKIATIDWAATIARHGVPASPQRPCKLCGRVNGVVLPANKDLAAKKADPVANLPAVDRLPMLISTSSTDLDIFRAGNGAQMYLCPDCALARKHYGVTGKNSFFLIDDVALGYGELPRHQGWALWDIPTPRPDRAVVAVATYTAQKNPNHTIHTLTANYDPNLMVLRMVNHPKTPSARRLAIDQDVTLRRATIAQLRDLCTAQQTVLSASAYRQMLREVMRILDAGTVIGNPTSYLMARLLMRQGLGLPQEDRNAE